ncbi:MAG: lamin tail domain-containing protein [Bacteroidales bacterium]|nr:lamin tail domain-containing protein [Bacteroidales bacterium]
MKKTITIFFFLTMLSGRNFAQFTDDFSDGNFTSNPGWSGDAAEFNVNPQFQLQLNASTEGVSSLSSASSISPVTEWRFWIRLAFSPSDNNYAKIYLSSDQPDMEGPLNGYFLRFGESGSQDAIELFRQTGTSVVSVCRGTEGLLAASFAVRIKVSRDEAGNWNLFADPLGGFDLKQEASGTDQGHSLAGWIGVSCKYTGSNSTKFYFDDFYMGPIQIDNIPPEFISVSLMTANSLKLQFNEGVNLENSGLNSNYSVNSGIGQPALAQRDALDPSLVYLTFNKNFESDISYDITVSGVTDFAGNSLTSQSKSFRWHESGSYELLITEILCDPDPAVSLPPFEFLEIYNSSPNAINLNGWNLNIGSTVKSLPEDNLGAGEYAILCDDDAVPYFESFGKLISFSTFTLPNTGTILILKNPQGRTVHSLNYDESWYHSDYKGYGGWSLEMIDPGNPCHGSDNWTASINTAGGTPGALNSVDAENPDTLSPHITSVGLPNSFCILLDFSEGMDTLALLNPMNYQVDQGIGSPFKVQLTGLSDRSIRLVFQTPLSSGVIYTLSVSADLRDCSGNAISIEPVKLAMPEVIEENDVVINEVLFDPKEGCVDFVELYNRSDKVLDLFELTLAEMDTISGSLFGICDLQTQSRLLFPGDYVAVCIDTASLASCYYCPNRQGLVMVEKMPSLTNGGGCLALAHKSGSLIDQMSYSESMQYGLLTNTDGISLERINPEISSNEPGNWHSAASTVGFATPAYQNSQFGAALLKEGELTVSPAIFSPDNDGHDDVLFISCKFLEKDTMPAFQFMMLWDYKSGASLPMNLQVHLPSGHGTEWIAKTGKHQLADM